MKGQARGSSRCGSQPASRRCGVVTRVAAPSNLPVKPPPVDPFAQKTVYKDNGLDLLFIKIYTNKMAQQLKSKCYKGARGMDRSDVSVPAVATYDDFVRVSKEIMRGRSPSQQKDLVLNVLSSLLPQQATTQFRRLFPPTKASAELNALFASKGFGWLVGEMELKSGDIKISPTEVRTQKSIVKIKKCRYLEASGCVGMCVNMCKVPTQSFFTDEFGLPLTMKPNFEDLSCEMIFGQPPEDEAVDAAFTQPCFKLQCMLGDEMVQKPCSKLQVGR